MFDGALSFHQQLCWSLKNLTTFDSMFNMSSGCLIGSCVTNSAIKSQLRLCRATPPTRAPVVTPSPPHTKANQSYVEKDQSLAETSNCSKQRKCSEIDQQGSGSSHQTLKPTPRRSHENWDEHKSMSSLSFLEKKLHFVTVYKCLFNKNLTIIIIIVELTNVL
jgi:hypothetical protein